MFSTNFNGLRKCLHDFNTCSVIVTIKRGSVPTPSKIYCDDTGIMHRELYPHKVPSRARQRRDKNHAEKIAELNENSINDPESKNSYEEARRLENRMPEPIREAHERKKQRDKKHYANDHKKTNRWR